MKTRRTPPERPTCPLIADDEKWNDDFDRDAMKDLWCLHGELGKFLETQRAFQAAGYRIRRAELVDSHPVWLFHLVPLASDGVLESNESLRGLRDILRRAGVYFRDKDVMMQRCGKQIIVSFLWPTPARGKARSRAWDEGRFQGPSGPDAPK
jgi:hypothetical protein